MEGILEWGIDIVIAIQKYRSPELDTFFLKVTSLGGDLFYFIAISLLYWSIDSKETAKFIVLFSIAYWINSELKGILNQPRPYNIMPELRIGHSSGGGGLPSYHAQGSFVFWGYLSVWFKKVPFTVLSVFFILLIAFSRIYLGRHFPTDIFAGWLIGLVLLSIFFISHDKIENWLIGNKLSRNILIAFLAPALLASINANSWSVSAMGVLSGFLVGYCIIRERIKFEASGTISQKIIRFIIGISVLALFHYGLKSILPYMEHTVYLIIAFIRFWIIGLWISAGAPWIFMRLKLVNSDVAS